MPVDVYTKCQQTFVPGLYGAPSLSACVVSFSFHYGTILAYVMYCSTVYVYFCHNSLWPKETEMSCFLGVTNRNFIIYCNNEKFVWNSSSTPNVDFCIIGVSQKTRREEPFWRLCINRTALIKWILKNRVWGWICLVEDTVHWRAVIQAHGCLVCWLLCSCVPTVVCTGASLHFLSLASSFF
jgi:hypothetical protein